MLMQTISKLLLHFDLFIIVICMSDDFVSLMKKIFVTG